MNLAESMRRLLLLFDAHLWRDAHHVKTRHPGSKRPAASKALCRGRRKRQRRARRRQRLAS